MATRDIYLKLEPVHGYSTVEPMAGPPRKYRRDCMRNARHEDASIPATEVEARRLNALIYREYPDPGYLIPKTDKIVLANPLVFECAFIHATERGGVVSRRAGEQATRG